MPAHPAALIVEPVGSITAVGDSVTTTALGAASSAPGFVAPATSKKLRRTLAARSFKESVVHRKRFPSGRGLVARTTDGHHTSNAVPVHDTESTAHTTASTSKAPSDDENDNDSEGDDESDASMSDWGRIDSDDEETKPFNIAKEQLTRKKEALKSEEH